MPVEVVKSVVLYYTNKWKMVDTKAGIPMSQAPDTAAVIVAAGSASRMGQNKQLMQISGSSVIVRTLCAFERCKDIAELIVVARTEDIGEIVRLAGQYGIVKLKAVVPGGADRRESVACGISEVSDSLSYVAIHDGARPFILPALISRCIADAREYGASTLAVQVKDTIKVAKNGFIISTPDRNTLWLCQTPQVFSLALYQKACKTAGAAQVTDDCTLVEQLGHRVHLTPGDYRNIKITTPEDITVANAIAQDGEFRMEEGD